MMVSIISYADFVSLIDVLAAVVGSVFNAFDSLIVVSIGTGGYTLLDVLVCALYLYALVDFVNWLRCLGGGSTAASDEPEYGPIRPRARNLKTGKVYRK